MYLPDRTIDTQSETASDKFSLAALIAWLRTKNPDEVYCWGNAGACLFSQYGTFLKLGHNEYDNYNQAIAGFRKRYPRADQIGEPWGIAHSTPHTFRAALSRALSIAGERE